MLYDYALWSLAIDSPYSLLHTIFFSVYVFKFLAYVIPPALGAYFNLYFLIPRYLEKNIMGQVNGEAIYAEKIISIQSSSITVRQIIAEHQQGKSDFLTFCQLVADAGVQKWVVDTRAMMCTYYDLAGNSMVAEPIPENGY